MKATTNLEEVLLDDKFSTDSELGTVSGGVVKLNVGDSVEGRFVAAPQEGTIFEIVDEPEHGSVAVMADGSYVFHSDVGYVGSDKFTFKTVTADGEEIVTNMDVVINSGPVVDFSGSISQVNTFHIGNQDSAAVAALDGGGYLVAWDSMSQDGSLDGVYAQRYDSQGQAVGGEFRVNSTTSNFQEDSAITAMNDGGFVITWQSENQESSSSEYDVYGQRYDDLGNTVGGEFLINTTTAGRQYDPAITATRDGGFVVTWASSDEDGGSFDVFGQRYDVDGNAKGVEFKINTTEAGNQDEPDITGVGNGFVISWSSPSNSANGYDIKAQLYDVDGVKVGDEISVNAISVTNPPKTSVTELTDGFLVSWASSGHTGRVNGVYGQRYDLHGDAVGDILSFSESTSDLHYQLHVDSIPGGGFVATWTAEPTHDSIDSDIYVRVFNELGIPVSDEINISLENSFYERYSDVAVTIDGDIILTWLGATSNGLDRDVYTKTISLTSLSRTLTGSNGNDAISGGDSSDNLVGLDGDDNLYGRVGDDILEGGNGKDVIYGEVGDDSLSGGGGYDTLDGGIGTDTAIFGGVLAEYQIVDTSEGFSVKEVSSGDTDQLISIENLQLADRELSISDGTSDDDLLTGTDGDDIIFGGDGADTLSGGAGDDILYTGTGSSLNHIINGGFEQIDAGYAPAQNNWVHINHEYIVGWEAEDASGNDDPRGNEIEVWNHYSNGGIVVSPTEGEYLVELDSDLAQDSISTSFNTENGAMYQLKIDLMARQPGTSDLEIKVGEDVVEKYVFDPAESMVWHEAIYEVLGNGSELTLTLTELADQNNTYGTFIDNIRLVKMDIVDGGSGNDKIVSSTGSDWISGGVGSDTFVFTSNFGNDVVTDFTSAENDKLIISGYGDDASRVSNIGALGDDVFIEMDDGSTLTVEDCEMADLDIVFDDDYIA